MLSGNQLFSGETVSDILACVLKQEPDLSAVPIRARRLIGRCLEKDPQKRLRDIGDFELLLESGSEVPGQTQVRPTGWIVAAAVATVVAVGALSLTAWIRLRPAPLPEVTRFQINAPPGSTLPLGIPAPSPDGRMLAYTVRGSDGVTRIDVRSMYSGESRALPATENAVHPFWSPDGRSLAFAADGDLKRVDLAGGAARSLNHTGSPWHGAWNQDGVILFQPAGFTEKIAAEGGASTPVVKPDGKKLVTFGGFPFFLPDGKRFLLAMTYADGTNNIELASLGSMERKVILPDVISAPILAPAGGKVYLLYLRDTSLMAQEFDETAGAVHGSAFLLVDGIGRVSGRSIRPSVGVSPNGVLAYQTGGDAEETYALRWFDRSGKALSQVLPATEGFEGNLSPDGRIVAMRNRSVTGTTDIWLVDLQRGSATRFTFGSAGNSYFAPIWSPDGRRLAYTLMGRGIYMKDVNGTGVEEELLKSEGYPLSWSPDGRQILFWRLGRLFLLPLNGAKEPLRVGPDDDLPLAGAQISPDGRYFAFVSRESGRDEVYTEAMPPGTGKWQISIAGGTAPRWRRDGKELFFLAPDRNVMAADIQTSHGIIAGVPHPLFRTSADLTVISNFYDLSADGQRFLARVSAARVVDSPITVVLNWWAGLKK
jgi:Tol biopolymer transport system component